MTPASENTRCIIFMMISMAGFAVEDAIIKQLSFDMPISQILMLTGGAGAVVFGLLARYRGVALLGPALNDRRFLLRNVGELVAAIFLVSAIVYGSLSAASAILQAVPLAVAAGSALFLGQRVAARQWWLIGLGFVGVLFIIQPGGEGFNPATLLAVIAVIALASRDVLTRSIAGNIDPLATSFWAFVALHASGWVSVPLFEEFSAVSMTHWGLIAASTVAAALAYMAVVHATRAGDMAVVAPFRYSRLLFAFILAVVFFDESITWPVMVGAGLIVLSGLGTLRRKPVAAQS